jgi:hypothetical protein
MALAVAYEERYGLKKRPAAEKLAAIAERWRP